MDSLGIFAIALAAGGWENVKLAQIVIGYSSNVTSSHYAEFNISSYWKLGICNIHVPCLGASATYVPISIVAPGSQIWMSFSAGSKAQKALEFSTSLIEAHSSQFDVEFISLLFTW